MRDFRFHIATLVGIFLALGVGIVLGYTLVVSQKIDPLNAQVIAVRKLNAAATEENKRLQESNADLSSEQQRLRSEVAQLAALAVVGRLSDRTVSLVSVGPAPNPALIDAVWRSLIAAGARRQNEVVIHGSLVPSDPANSQEILTRIQAQNGTSAEETIGDAVARTIAGAGDPLLLAALSHRGVGIDYSGSFAARPSVVVLLCEIGSRDRLDAVERGDTTETTLVRAFEGMNLRTVEAESSSDPETAASYFRRLGVASVDNVETREGRIALVFACLGYTGHFGDRPSADQLLPEPSGAAP